MIDTLRTMPQKLALLPALLTVGCFTEQGGTVTQNSETPGEQPSSEVSNAGATGIAINEFVPSNATGITDEGGGTGDWIELYNLSTEAIDLGGYFVSDKTDNPTKHELPAGLVIEANGTLLLWADSDPEQGPRHLSFNLKKDGESIVLTSPLGDTLDSIDYEEATTDFSFARLPDGTGEFVFCHTPTPGALNDPSCQP